MAHAVRYCCSTVVRRIDEMIWIECGEKERGGVHQGALAVACIICAVDAHIRKEGQTTAVRREVRDTITQYMSRFQLYKYS